MALILMLFPGYKLLAQEYVITQKNDTLKCEISNRVFGGLSYRVNGKSSYIKIKPENIKEYCKVTDGGKFSEVTGWENDTSIYVRRIMPKKNDTVFIHLMERGKISLYEKQTSGYASSGPGGSYVSSGSLFWFVTKNSDLLILITQPGVLAGNRTVLASQNNFMSLLADNPSLLERFKLAISTAYPSYNLIKYYIKTYNEEYAEKHPGK
ncbi:hypothetical protein BH09BAC6_BH09BAC6_22210 [soil metagenome]